MRFSIVDEYPCKNYESQAGLGPTRGPLVFGPGRSLTGPKIYSQKIKFLCSN
jgi:hypothetical protein